MMDKLKDYTVRWLEPSVDSAGSMPLGNGDIGLNVWVEQGGDLLFYIGKTDAWSESGRLLKLARIRVSLDPNPFAKGKPFLQELELSTGSIRLCAGESGVDEVRMLLWVDAGGPYVRLEAEGDQPFELAVSIEGWRQEQRILNEQELGVANLTGSPVPIVEDADTIVEHEEEQLVWYHRNERSVWSSILEHQGLGHLTMGENALPDPLMHRTFGGMIRGTGLVKESRSRLKAVKAVDRYAVDLVVLTEKTSSVDQWIKLAERKLAARYEASAAYTAHKAWWRQFWDRSHVLVKGESLEARQVTEGYLLQRFVSACGGRGVYPIKFNGSIFTFDTHHRNEYEDIQGDADYRRWGGGYWFQNTRLPYWPMLASGDYEMMLPLFRMFRDALPLAQARTRSYYGHEGAFFPETMSFWGTYLQKDYGWERDGKAVAEVDNSYIRYYVQNNLELCVLLLECYEHTLDHVFLREYVLPMVSAILTFFEQHYPREADGLLRIEPAQALENWHEAVNPLPELAGLRIVLEKLMSLPIEVEDQGLRDRWMQLNEVMPELPVTKTESGHTVYAPADTVVGDLKNLENVELYATFPYRLAAVGTSQLELGRSTYEVRRFKRTGGWRQDAIQAAYLGLAEEARLMVVSNFSRPYVGARFPAFWGPNFDWIPDQDHGTVAVMALQSMLLQTEGRRLLMLPAWPADWDVTFKLCAPYATTLEGEIKDGQLVRFKVEPEERLHDVEWMHSEVRLHGKGAAE